MMLLTSVAVASAAFAEAPDCNCKLQKHKRYRADIDIFVGVMVCSELYISAQSCGREDCFSHHVVAQTGVSPSIVVANQAARFNYVTRRQKARATWFPPNKEAMARYGSSAFLIKNKKAICRTRLGNL